MPTNYRYITPPENSINVPQFFSDIEVITEKCVCGSAFWPGKWDQHSSVFTNDFKNWLASFNCYIFRAEAFLVQPGKALVWHIDSNDDPTATDLDPNLVTKINFMWCGDLTKCFMEYGELTNPDDGLTVRRNDRGRLVYTYDPAKMTVFERFSLEHTVLINRGIPHRVVNESTSDWSCLSCIIQSTETGRPVQFSDAIELFDSVCMG
jgi:hypothetical protein